MDLDESSCPGCRVPAWHPHEQGCDHAHCPGCGEQLLLHDCGDSDRPSLWRGANPDELGAVQAGMWWWHSAPDIRSWVPDAARARAKLRWDPAEQIYVTHQR